MHAQGGAGIIVIAPVYDREKTTALEKRRFGHEVKDSPPKNKTRDERNGEF